MFSIKNKTMRRISLNIPPGNKKEKAIEAISVLNILFLFCTLYAAMHGPWAVHRNTSVCRFLCK